MSPRPRSVVRRARLLALTGIWISAAAAPRAAALPAPNAAEKIGPFALESPDRRWRLQVGLVGQLRYQLDIDENASEELVETDNKVLIRRIRLNLKGRIISRRLSYRLQLNTAPGALELMDFFLDYHIGRAIRARLGGFKIPLSRYRGGSFAQLTFNDWSITTRYFGAERQMGLMVYRAAADRPGLSWEAGIFTGENARASHAVGLARLFGETVDSASDLVDPAPPASFHPELAIRATFDHGKINTRTDTDFAGGPPRLSASLGAAWDLRPDRVRDLSIRFAPELLVKVRGVSLFGAFYLGAYQAEENFWSQRLGLLGGLVQGSYLFAGRFEVSLRYAIVYMTEPLRASAGAWGAERIADGTGEDEIRALTRKYGGAGALEEDQELTAGFNLYLVGTSLKLQTDFSWLQQQKRGRDQIGLRLRCQLQLAF